MQSPPRYPFPSYYYFDSDTKQQRRQGGNVGHAPLLCLSNEEGQARRSMKTSNPVAVADRSFLQRERVGTLAPVLFFRVPGFREKLSEKSRTLLQRSLTGHRNGTCRPVLAFVYYPNLRSKRCSYPFSDSFRREILGNPICATTHSWKPYI